MAKALRLLALLALCSVIFAQTRPRSQLLVVGTLQSSSAQLSFQLQTSADSIPTIDNLKFQNINLVAFGINSALFHNHTSFPLKTDECDEKALRQQSPADAPFWERQNFGLTFSPSSVRDDGTGNIIVSGVAQGSYELLQAVYPVPTRCANEKYDTEDCDEFPARTTTVAVSIKLSSSDGALSQLQKIVRGRTNNTVESLSWVVDYSIESRIADDQAKRGFTNFKLSAATALRPVAKIDAVITDVFLPVYKIWRSLKVQPVGIRTNPFKLCLSVPCFCCSYTWIFDLNPTGPKGLNFGKPGADTQWKKAGITFDWQPIVYLTDGTLKTLDTTTEESNLYNSYSDASAVEIFFARQFNPVSKYGGGFTIYSGTASAKIVSTEYMIDDCNKDFTHLAHELGHVLDLPHPPGSSPASSTNTLMCPSGYCNDNPKRNSLENQNSANNPLITYYLSTTSQTADDCTASADCGTCPPSA